MKVIIAGDRECEDYQFLLDAITESGFQIQEVVSGTARGGDELGEQYAAMNNLKVMKFAAKWNDISHPQALVKVNQWGKQYNAKAGFIRNEEMAMYADALIALQPSGPTPGTQDMIKRARDKGLKVYIHTGKVQEIPQGEEIPF